MVRLQQSAILITLFLRVVPVVGLCILDLLIGRELGDRGVNRPIVYNSDVIKTSSLDFRDKIHLGILQNECDPLP